jgi:cytoplasmic iron level regulating protein YaaA (DUF328/UPF0246 family)
MLTLISPAKKLLPITKPFSGVMTEPEQSTWTHTLIEIMKSKTVADLAQLMSLSSDLAHLNYDRYQRFSFDKLSPHLAYPALFLFQGDVYQGLQAKTWSPDEVAYSQNHLGILSGLYGLLRPLDGIQPYRLEMGVRLANPQGATLYNFWSRALTEHLNKTLAGHQNPLLINLASTEYFKVVQEKQLNHPVVTINFYEQKNNELKMVGVHAKKARGVMAKYLIRHRIDDLSQIRGFNQLGYCFNEASSSEKRLDFIRVHD